MKLTFDTAVINRNVQSISLKLKLKLQSMKKQAKLIGEVFFSAGQSLLSENVSRSDRDSDRRRC